MKYAKVERQIAGRTFALETGRIARQAHGAVLASFGETMVLSTVCAAKSRPDIDFFPLSVEYREKHYAAGKFPGGFMKREGRPSTKEILTCRLIDRPLRPLWPEAYKEEVQIISMVVSVDRENEPDVIAMNGCFAACHLAPLPFEGPVSAVRVGRVDGQFIAFPTLEQSDAGDLDLVIACSRDAIVMVEGVAYEIPESEFLQALDFGRKICDQILDLMDELKRKAAPAPSTWVAPVVERDEVFHRVKKDYARPMRRALMTQGKHERYAAVKALKDDALERLVSQDDPKADARKKAISEAFSELGSEQTRALILEEGKRVDKRGLEDIREITIETKILPRAHGSSLFTRGETQALVNVTLGTPRDQQVVDGLMEEYSKRLDLHYNFPPFSVGEVKPMRGTGRREMGHGNLAERALSSILPPEDDFPYAIRIVSEITESNGSSSMATVCGGTIALMDAGVPIRQPVAGIAMGLVTDGEDTAILSDILGSEDHVGDMDFKVAGTGRGITAVQMDIKIKGLTRELMVKALDQARRGRLHILREMIKAIPAPRGEISPFAPRLIQVKISPDKIGLVIGPGGKTIKRIQEETGATVEIDDEGIVSIASIDGKAAEEAKQMIDHLTAEVEVGKIYEGRVVALKDFGCFVEVLPGQEGLCHVSELDTQRVAEVSDVVSIGERIRVKILMRDEQGRLKLSRRAVLEEEAAAAAARPLRRPPEASLVDEDEEPRPARARRPRAASDEEPTEAPRPVRRPRAAESGSERPRRAPADEAAAQTEGDEPARGRREYRARSAAPDSDRPRRSDPRRPPRRG